MSQPIKIIVTAETAEAAVALQRFVAQTHSGLKQLSQGGEQAAAGMTITREGVRSLTDPLRGLNYALMLAGGSFPELTRGLGLTTAGLMGTRAASVSLGLSLSQILPLVAIVAAVIGTGVAVWDHYSSQEKDAAERAKELNDALEKIPETLKQIREASEAGLIGPGAAGFLSRLLTGAEPQTVQMPLSQAIRENRLSSPQARSRAGLDEQEYQRAGFTAFDPDKMVNVEATLVERAKMTNAELVKRGYLLEELDAKGKGTGKYKTTVEGQALVEAHDLDQKAHEASLAGYEKERAAAKQKYDEELQQYKNLQAIANAKLPGGQTQAQRALLTTLPQTKTDIEAEYKTRTAEIDKKQAEESQKQSEEATRKSAESQTKLREQYSREFATANKQIEADISLAAEQAGKKREEFYSQEYVQRSVLAFKFLLQGKISEADYAAYITEQETNLYKGKNAAELAAQRDAQTGMLEKRADIEAQIEAIQSNNLLTRLEKEQAEVGLKRQLLDLDQQWLVVQQQLNARSSEAVAKQGYEREIERLNNEIARLKNEVPEQSAPGSLAGGFTASETQLRQRLQDEQSNALAVPFEAFDSSLDKSLTNLIEKGGSMRQFWKSLTLGMADDMLRAGVQMLADEVTLQAMQSAKFVANTLFRTAVHTAGEETQTTATAGGAVQRGMIRVGETVLHGVQVGIRVAAHVAGEILQTTITVVQSAIRIAVILAETIPYLIKAAIEAIAAFADIPYVGPALGIAAAGAIIAAGAGIMSRDSGGRGEAGQVYAIGTGAQPEYYIPDSAGSFYPRGMISQLAAAGGGGSQPPAGGAPGGDVKFEHYLVYNDQQFFDKMKSSTARKIFVTHLSDPGVKSQAGLTT